MNFEDIDYFLSELTPLEFEFLSDLACRMNEPEIAEKHQVPVLLVMDSLESVVEQLQVEDVFEAIELYTIWIVEYERTQMRKRAAN